MESRKGGSAAVVFSSACPSVSGSVRQTRKTRAHYASPLPSFLRQLDNQAPTYNAPRLVGAKRTKLLFLSPLESLRSRLVEDGIARRVD